MYEPYVITLNTSSDRFQVFERLNRHLNFKIFNAIKGSEIGSSERIEKGYITAGCAASNLVTDGNLGCTISHWMLWKEAVKLQKNLLIMEDDAATHPEIDSWIKQERLPEAFDLILFGVNTDSIMEIQTPEGMRYASIFELKYPTYQWIQSTLEKTDISSVRSMRLFKAFGCCCYLISPQGAAKLVDMVFPLRLQGTLIPILKATMPGVGVDRRLNAIYENINAYLTLPFLAWTPNSDSTTRR